MGQTMTRNTLSAGSVWLFSVVFLAAIQAAAQQAPPPAQSLQQLKANYGKVPLSFEPNQGQTDPRVQFLTRGSGYSVFLTAGGMVLSLHSSDTPVETATAPADTRQPARTGGAAATKSAPTSGNAPTNLKTADTTLLFNLVGANPNPQVLGQDLLPGRVNYFVGNDPRKWQTNVPTYGSVRYKNVYPGIDLVYYGNHHEIEYDLAVAPGADTSKIQFEIKGADRLLIDSQGDLIVTKAGSQLHFKSPVVYQESNGIRTPVNGGYMLRDATHVQFNLSRHDPSKLLVIDPVLVYSTYLGGSADDFMSGIAVDSTGSAYVTGYTLSSNFPLANPGSLPPYTYHVFVTKLDVSGANVIYSDYVGGSSSDYGRGIVLDSINDVYITGSTCSNDFPLVNAYQSTFRACNSAFISKIAPDGASLLYSTFLSGSADSEAMSIALDSSNEIYVAGHTWASDFPLQNAYQSSVSPNQNGQWGDYGFLTKFSADGASLIYSTYLGGNTNLQETCYYGPCWPYPDNQITGIAVDASGNAYVGGYTNTYNFPTSMGAYQTTNTTTYNPQVGFVGSFSASGALNYSTYFGGFNNDWLNVTAIAVDANGSAYITGQAPSDGSFPVTSISLCDPGIYGYGCSYAFVTKFDPTGATLSYSTFLGPYNYASPHSIVLDTYNDAYVVADTGSSSFALVNGLEPYTNNQDAMLVEIDPLASSELFATLLGGNGYDSPASMALDSSGAMYVAGNTTSTDFPVTQAAFQNTLGGNQDTFIMKIGTGSAPAVSISPFLLQYSIRQVGNQSQPQTALLRNMGSSPLNISSITISGDFSETDNCGTSVPAAGNCTFTVTFTPTAPGPRYGSILILDDAAGSPQFINLVGDGSTAVVSLSPNGLSFPSLPLNQSSTPQTVTLANNGNATLNLSNIQIDSSFSQTNNCPIQLPFGSSCQFQITFTPTAGGAITGNLTLTDNAPDSPQTVALSGSGYVTTATVAPSTLAFGNQNLNSASAAQIVTVTNTGVNAMTISLISVTAGFAQTNNCTMIAPSGGACTINVFFKPTASGTISGTLTVNDNAQGNPHTVALNGTGIAGTVSLSSSGLTFAAQTVGTSSTAQTINLTNNGNGPLTMAGITASGDFSATSNCTSVAASGSCTVQVTFVPTSSGSRIGTLTLADSASDSPQAVTLSGSGIDFGIVASAGNAAIKAGGSATYQLAINPVGGSFYGSVALSCNGVPALSTCTVNPTSVTPGGNSSTATVTVKTTGASAQLLTRATSRGLFAWWTLPQGLGMFGVLLLGPNGGRRRKPGWRVALGVLLLAMLLLVGCGGTAAPAPPRGNSNATPTGTYTLVVIGSSGSVQHFTTLTLTVQ
jgi:hypothetical protein